MANVSSNGECCSVASDAKMAHTNNGTAMNGASCRVQQEKDVIFDKVEGSNRMMSSADGSTDESTTFNSLDVEPSLDARANNNDADGTESNDPTTNQIRGIKPAPLTLDKTPSEDNLINTLPSLNINASSSIISPSSILSDSTVDDAKSPTSSADVNGFHQQNHEAHALARNLAAEHRIFLRAALDMLAEREQLRVFADVHDPNNIIKTGTLRKASHRIKGVWKTKHVEIREGVFSYVSGGSKKSTSSRKDILLRASSCTCRAVKIRSVKIRPSTFGNGFVFELKIHGGSRRLWMANTKEERLSWMQAIHSAMIGASVTRSDNFLEYHMDNNSGKKKGCKLPVNSPYQSDLEQYLEIGEACTRAVTKAEYLSALQPLRGTSISVPVQWIKSQLDDTPAASAFLEHDISSCVEQLWKDLVRDSVSINGQVLTGESHGPDRIVGKLTQQILFSDKSQNRDAADRITESQSVLYARNILLGANRTRTGGDSYYCAEHLCTNRDLVVICPSSTEANPLSITVRASRCRETGQNVKSSLDSLPKLSIRTSTRSGMDDPWEMMNLVLMEDSIHLYDTSENSLHMVSLTGVKVTASSKCSSVESHTAEHVITLANDEEGLTREFLFDDELDFFLWRSSIENVVVDCDCNAKQSAEKSMQDDVTKSGASTEVDVSVNVSTEYKICTLDPQGIDDEDTWGTMRTTFKQQFRLCGGPSGKIFRGDEVVQIELL